MSNTILVVEDDAGLREALIDTLEMSGIACVAADSAEQAMIQLKKSANCNIWSRNRTTYITNF